MDFCSDVFTSEEYTEYILRDGYYTRRALEPYADYCIAGVSDKWAIVSFNINMTQESTFERLGYSFLPKLYGLSDVTAVNAAGITAVRQQPVLELYGSGTYIAIIDTGINWRHEAFLNSDGTSRIEVMWDQQTNRIYYNRDINEALAGGGDIPGDDIGHGTYMAGVAAGNINRQSGFSGVAPYSRLIVVRLQQAKHYLRDIYFVRDNVPAYSEADIMRAVAFVSDYSEQKGVTVSYAIGMGSNLGHMRAYRRLPNILVMRRRDRDIASHCQWVMREMSGCTLRAAYPAMKYRVLKSKSDGARMDLYVNCGQWLRKYILWK